MPLPLGCGTILVCYLAEAAADAPPRPASSRDRGCKVEERRGQGDRARVSFAEGDVSPPSVPWPCPWPAGPSSLPTSRSPRPPPRQRAPRPSARPPPAEGNVPAVGSCATSRPLAHALFGPAAGASCAKRSHLAIWWPCPQRRISRGRRRGLIRDAFDQAIIHYQHKRKAAAIVDKANTIPMLGDTLFDASEPLKEEANESFYYTTQYGA